MNVKIIIYRQNIKIKEDKELKSYDVLNTKDFINGINTVEAKNVNTYVRTNKALTSCDFSTFEGQLEDFNLKHDKIKTFDGIFHLLVVCVTKKGTYYNMYIAKNTPLGLVHHSVKCNPIIRSENTIDF